MPRPTACLPGVCTAERPVAGNGSWLERQLASPMPGPTFRFLDSWLLTECTGCARLEAVQGASVGAVPPCPNKSSIATMVTIRQIAREASVSVGTVSNVLNNPSFVSDETRERVLRVIRHHNYRPSAVARGLATRQTRLFGLIVSSIFNPFTGEVVEAPVK